MACLLREKMEKLRIEIREQISLVDVQLDKYKDQQTGQMFQVLKSKRRKLVRQMNQLTKGINELKEVDLDDQSRKYLDEVYIKLEKGEITMEELQAQQSILKNAVEQDDINTDKELDDITDEELRDEIDNLLDNL